MFRDFNVVRRASRKGSLGVAAAVLEMSMAVLLGFEEHGKFGARGCIAAATALRKAPFVVGGEPHSTSGSSSMRSREAPKVIRIEKKLRRRSPRRPWRA